MLNKFKYVFKHTAIYSIGNISTKLIGLILLPLYTSHLTTADYGVLAILEITSQVLIATLGLNLARAMMRWYAVEHNSQNQRNIVMTTYASVGLMALVFVLLSFPFAGDFSLLFFGSTSFANYFFILSFWVAFEILNRVTLDFIRINERSLFFMTLVISKFVSILFMNIYFVAYLNMGVEGIILGQTLGNLLVMLITLPFIVSSVKGGKIKRKLFGEMVNYSSPLVFSTISTMVLTMSDRYLIKYLSDYSQVGIYSLGYKIAGVINIFIIQSFQLGFLPVAYKMFNSEGAERFFSKVATYLTLVLFVAAIGVTAFSREVIVLFAQSNENYWIAYTIVPLLSLTFILRGLNYMVSMGLHYVKKTKYNAYIVFSAALVNIVLNVFLIPLWGIYGAALATVIAHILMIVLFYRKTQKFYPIAYEKKRIATLFLIGTGILGLLLIVDIAGIFSWWKTALKAFLVLAFPILLYLTGFFYIQEKILFRGAWNKWKNPSALKENISIFLKQDTKDEK